MEGVIVVAATNRPEMIDPALLRSGRFERVMHVPPPDPEALKSILEIHTEICLSENSRWMKSLPN